jgi:[citrate (pro-3S)-lyase] ligase
VIEVPRATVEGIPISASEVRRRLAQQDFSKLRELVPPTTFNYLETKFRTVVAVTE